MRTRLLRESSLLELRPLLDEEAAWWESELGWDFTDVRTAVAGGVERGSLSGRLVSDGGRPVGYCYYMVDSGRVILGSIFAARSHRGRGLEDALVDAVVEDARAERGSSTGRHPSSGKWFAPVTWGGRAARGFLPTASEPAGRVGTAPP